MDDCEKYVPTKKIILMNGVDPFKPAYPIITPPDVNCADDESMHLRDNLAVECLLLKSTSLACDTITLVMDYLKIYVDPETMEVPYNRIINIQLKKPIDYDPVFWDKPFHVGRYCGMTPRYVRGRDEYYVKWWIENLSPPHLANNYIEKMMIL